jgi:hypothetical protein
VIKHICRLASIRHPASAGSMRSRVCSQCANTEGGGVLRMAGWAARRSAIPPGREGGFCGYRSAFGGTSWMSPDLQKRKTDHYTGVQGHSMECHD